MRALSTIPSLLSLAISSFVLAGCGGNSAPSPLYTIGGTVVNLAGMNGGLILQDSFGNKLPVSANGSFVFPTAVASGGPYNVTISAQPSNPVQICGVADGSGTVTANVTNVNINCGHNEWTWVKGTNTVSQNGVYATLSVPTISSNPGGRNSPVTWTDASGSQWLFGGYGFDSVGTLLPMNDLWKFTAGQWTWMAGSKLGGQKGSYGTLGISGADNIPGARLEAVSWTDAAGDVWLFGGNGYDSVGTEAWLNDLWKYSNGEWTWMGGSNLANQMGTYGTLGVPSADNVPSPRSPAVSWADSSGNFWLFGGTGHDSTGKDGNLNDLWKYSGGQWTWVSGSKLGNQNGVYGTRGIAAPGNVPGARIWSVGWTDLSGNLWLFGGTAMSGVFNDLWKYSNGEWTWVSGSESVFQPGDYGSLGVSAATNIPGSRQLAVGWTDAAGDFWLFGGGGMDSVGSAGLLNDLWKYSNGEWTWMSGSNLINQNGMYGVQGTPAPGNVPGARLLSGRWVDGKGNLLLFGGYGVPASGSEGDLNDLWMYMP